MFGLMRTSKHRRIYVEQGQAYRREIEETRFEAQQARDKLARWSRGLVRRVHSDSYPIGGGVMIRVEFSDQLVRSHTMPELQRMVAEEVVRQLAGLNHRDPRPDLRAVNC